MNELRQLQPWVTHMHLSAFPSCPDKMPQKPVLVLKKKIHITSNTKMVRKYADINLSIFLLLKENELVKELGGIILTQDSLSHNANTVTERNMKSD